MRMWPANFSMTSSNLLVTSSSSGSSFANSSAYEDVASKFFEHFVNIAHAMNDMGAHGRALWDEEDGFYYDVLHLPSGEEHFLKIRSMVGLIPLFAVETLEPEIVDRLPGFKRRMQWFLQ